MGDHHRFPKRGRGHTRPFVPLRGFGGAHMQTILGTLGAPHPGDFPHEILKVPLFDGDQLVLRVNRPARDRPTGPLDKPLVLLLHGLAGSSESSYILRLTAKLNRQGFTVIRFNHRGCAPEGRALAKGIYHAGRIEDIDGTVQFLKGHFPHKKLLVAGFSLSANMLLRFLGERFEQVTHSNLLGALAVNPPIDLEACSQALCRKDNFYIDRFFTRLMLQTVQARCQIFPDEPTLVWPTTLNLRIFDELFTAPRAGFKSREDYYHLSSAKHSLHKIRLPTEILGALDDPIIPPSTFENITLSPETSLRIESHGGHLGYIGRHKTVHGDRRWMDEFVLNWIQSFDLPR